ncbi:hypothetical protein MMC24_007557 [Lignoscripta atroalba]|nr:hypothetical protein [Lignoscripta atroalba]
MSIIPLSRTLSPLKGLTQKAKPIIDITLHDEQEGSFVPSYTTLDKIEGEVSITAPVNMDFEDIRITFQGATRSYVEKIATSAPTNGRTHATHNFLRLVQPIPESSLPQSRILEAGRKYTFSFTFVVPERLLPQACTHERDNEQIQEEHLSLPPSFGDPMMASDGKTLMDDLAPDMAVISYALRVIITRRQDNGSKPFNIADSLKKLRIIPAVNELPPLDVPSGKDCDYTLRKEKDLKKGMFKGKLGRLTVEAAQPKSLQLFPVKSKSSCPITTMVVFNLRFDPAEEGAQPPRLGSLVNKLKVNTFYASAPMRGFPLKSNSLIYDTQRGHHVETLSLSSRCVQSAQWHAHQDSSSPSQQIRRDSALSINSVTNGFPEPSSAYAGKRFYTAKILVPVNLPANKTFTPTFHSCLVSRVYALDLTLSVHTPSTTVSVPSMHLKIPVQISSEGNLDAHATISEGEAHAIAAREADNVFMPRIVGAPSPEYTERAELVSSTRQVGFDRSEDMVAPPGYSMLAGGRSSMGLGMERQVGIVPARG